jgi:hypothetical protein
MKFQVLDVDGGLLLKLPVPLPYWLTFQIRLAVDGSGVATA